MTDGKKNHDDPMTTMGNMCEPVKPPFTEEDNEKATTKFAEIRALLDGTIPDSNDVSGKALALMELRMTIYPTKLFFEKYQKSGNKRDGDALTLALLKAKSAVNALRGKYDWVEELDGLIVDVMHIVHGANTD